MPHITDDLPSQTVELAESTLPPLPATARFELDSSKPVPKVFSLEAKPPVDSGLVQTSVQVPTDKMVNTDLAKSVVPPKPDLISPDSTRKVVEKLVGGTQELNSDSTEESQRPVDLKIQKAQNVQSGASEKSLELTYQFLDKERESPSLETLPPLKPEEPMQLRKSESLTIPKAAVCRSIKGRGHFVAMPEAFIQPGSTVLVYWELDGLTRDKITQSARLDVTVELIRTNRESIVASVHESLEKQDTSDPLSDFAAMQWQLPADLSTGEYILRITSRDESAKTSAEYNLSMVVSAPASKSR